jgi:hypothetical protein
VKRRELIALTAATVAVGLGGALVATQIKPAPSASPSPRASTTRLGDARVRRLIRLQEPVQEFGSLGGPLAWSPDSSRLCVEQTTRGGARTVSVFSTVDWTQVCQFKGSRPIWALDGRSLAAVWPFPATVPPPADTVVLMIDPSSGAERSRRAVPASGLGWSGGQLYGVVDGRVVAILDPSRASISCAGACELAYWSPAGNLLVVANRADAPLLELHDLQRTPTRVHALGMAKAIAWAAAAPALAWVSDDRVRTWSPESGVQVADFPPAYKPVVWSPKGELLIAAHVSGTWKQWRPADRVIDDVTMPFDLDLNSLVSWSPDARFIAATPAGYGTVGVRVHPVVADSSRWLSPHDYDHRRASTAAARRDILSSE